MIKKILRKFSSILKELQNFLFSLFGSAKYWESNLVAHDVFKNSLESLDHFHWRNLQYPGYIELMGVKNHDNKTILDYGFEGKLEGVSISNRELSLINHRNEALNDKALSEESKEFLQNLKFNSNGLPTYENQIAGINACYTFNKKRT